MGPHFQHRYKHLYYATKYSTNAHILIQCVSTSVNQFEPATSQATDREEQREGGFEPGASVFFVYLVRWVNGSQSRSKPHDLRGRNLPNICSSRRLDGAQREEEDDAGCAVYLDVACYDLSFKNTHT